MLSIRNVYNCRSDRLSAFRRPFANRWLNIAVAWLMTVALAFSIVPVLEAVKWMARWGWFGDLA